MMIQKLLLNNQMVWKIFVKILTNAIIASMINNKKLNPIITELFIRDRKLSISIVFITQSYFKVSKDVRLIIQTFLLWKFKIKENFNKLL